MGKINEIIKTDILRQVRHISRDSEPFLLALSERYDKMKKSNNLMEDTNILMEDLDNLIFELEAIYQKIKDLSRYIEDDNKI